MKIRILSDLHLDVNREEPFSLRDKNTFTILCGDISGDPNLTTEWIKKNVNHGVFVAGNHLVYNNRGKGIQELREEMAKADTGDVTYLDCMVDGQPIHRELDDNTVIVGSTMYTDFKLTGRGPQQPEDLTILQNKRRSLRCMNDYRWGMVKRDDGTMRALNPDDLEEAFDDFYRKLQIAVEDTYRDKNIIVVTHYCPSKKCISEDYLDDDNNSSYVSELDDYILKHPNIKLWCCGHVHHQASHKVGDCLIVMNPRGYVSRLEDREFDSRLYVDTDDWSLHKHKKTAAEQKKFNARRENLLKYIPFFL